MQVITINDIVGKKAIIRVTIDGKELFYNAQITSFSNDLVCFIDRHNKIYCHSHRNITEIAIKE